MNTYTPGYLCVGCSQWVYGGEHVCPGFRFWNLETTTGTAPVTQPPKPEKSRKHVLADIAHSTKEQAAVAAESLERLTQIHGLLTRIVDRQERIDRSASPDPVDD